MCPFFKKKKGKERKRKRKKKFLHIYSEQIHESTLLHAQRVERSSSSAPVASGLKGESAREEKVTNYKRRPGEGAAAGG